MPRFYGVPKTPEAIPGPAASPPPFNQKVITTVGAETYLNSMISIPQHSTMSFHGKITATIHADNQSATWDFSGIIKRDTNALSTVLVGLSSYDVIADTLFSETYIDINADKANGSLIISHTGIANKTIVWSTSIELGATV